jgi:hypothetical protein
VTFSWVRRRTKELTKLVRAFTQTGVGVLTGVKRFVVLTSRYRFSPTEVFAHGLLDGRLEREPDAITSNERLLDVQRRLNARGRTDSTENKIDFQLKCTDLGLPLPELLAVLGCPPNELFSHLEVADASALAEAICSSRWNAVVLKPVYGVHGRGVLALDCKPGRAIAPGGAVYDVPRLLKHMENGGFSAWMLQERLRPHPDCVRATDAEALSTFRITTLSRGPDEIEVLSIRMRLAMPGASVDNISFGTTGNIVANISPTTLEVTSVIRPRPDGLGYDRVDRHPVTGVKLVGWRVPFAREAYGLSVRAARGFYPLRTVGWDVGISDIGARLIEGNSFWDAGIGTECWPQNWRKLVGALVADGSVQI